MNPEALSGMRNGFRDGSRLADFLHYICEHGDLGLNLSIRITL